LISSTIYIIRKRRMYQAAPLHHVPRFPLDPVPAHPAKVSRTITTIAIMLFISMGVLVLLSSHQNQHTPNDLIELSQKKNFNNEIKMIQETDLGRFPVSYDKYVVNLFSHPKVIETFSDPDIDENAYEICYGPEENVVVYLDENSVASVDGYSVFNLDCRNTLGKELVWFLMVIDMYGNIVAIHSPEKRVETVSVISSDTILYSMINKHGSYLWKWQADEHEKLPFNADSHSLIYHELDNTYYGFIPVKAGGSPDTVVGWGGITGREVFKYEINMPDDLIHANYLSISGEHIYIGLRDQSSILKVNRKTRNLEYVLGGFQSDFDIIDEQGEIFSAKSGEYFETWMGQHKFQIIEDEDDKKVFSLFNNNYRVDGTKSGTSQMMVLHAHENERVAKVHFTFDTKESSTIYGGCDILPFGGLLGNSYPNRISPEVEDLQYHVNIWELSSDGNLAWRVGFKGFNPQVEQASDEPYIKMYPNASTPTGWNIMMVERFYSRPIVGSICRQQETHEGVTVQIESYNSVRTQHEYTGTALLYQGLLEHPLGNDDIITKTTFSFQRAFVQSFASLFVPNEYANSDMTLQIISPWNEITTVALEGGTVEISDC